MYLVFGLIVFAIGALLGWQAPALIASWRASREPIDLVICYANVDELHRRIKQGWKPDGEDLLGRSSPALLLAQEHQCRRSEEIMYLLLKAGADPNITSRHGELPLVWAVGNLDFARVSTLIEFGADVNKRDGRGQTPIMTSMGYDGNKLRNVVMAKYLLALGADVTLKDEKGRPAWAEAEAANMQEVVAVMKQAYDKAIGNK